MESKNLIQEVTENILLLLDKVASGDIQTWIPLTGLAYNPVSKHRYTAINQLLLSFAMMQKNYEVNNWLTFQQIKDAGGFVLKGEQSTPVTFSEVIYLKEGIKITPKEARRHFLDAQDKDPTISTYREAGINTKRFLKYYLVFNVAQTKDIPEVLFTRGQPILSEIERNGQIDQLIACHKVQIHHAHGDSAHYNPQTDVIQMPFSKQFTTSEQYYAVLFHELVHWTGHEARLNRLFSRNETDYAFEELIAELGSAILCAELIIPAPLRSAAAYIQSWLKALEDDKNYLIKAVSHAERASKYLMKPQSLAV